MASVAPEGYTSYQAAFEDLMEFGWGIWTPNEMAALTFHARRARGKESDAHSLKQALEGIRSKDQTRLICGPSGLSKGTWIRTNIALEKTGVLTRTRRTNRFGKDDATEFTLNWRVISAEIESLKNVGVVPQSGVLGPPTAQSLVPQSGVVSTPEWGSPVPQSGVVGMDRIRVPHSETHLSQSQNLTSKVSHFARACDAIRNAIEHATQEIVQDDRLIYAILEHGCRNDLPPAAQARCIEWLVYDRKAEGYQARAGLVLRIVREDSVTWAKENGSLVFRLQMEARAEGWSPEIMREEAGAQLAQGAAFKIPSSSEKLQHGKARNQTA